MDPLTAKMAVQLSATLARNRGGRYLLGALVLLILAANLALVFGPWMLTAQLTAAQRGQRQATTDGGSCGGSADLIDTKAASAGSLSVEQVGNARTIWRVAQQLGAGDQGAVVGIATALQESALRNLSYGDRDSVGLFQQRASQGWGTPAQLQNPIYAAAAFYDRLVTVSGWQTAPVTAAAQAVQRSGAPEAYADWEPEA